MNNIRPKIGIPLPTSIDPAYNQRSWPSYADAIRRSGGEPMEIGLSLAPEDLTKLAQTLDGFLLPGSPADVDPERYDTPRIEACGPADPPRERMDYFLLETALATGKPILGICYGCQSMHTYFGGTLIQDLSPLPVNHSAGAGVSIAHTALIAQDSILGKLLMADPEAAAEAPADATQTFRRLPINSSHHQSAATTAPSMRVSARCPDDEVVEAIEPTTMFHVEHPGFILGVQWHPERSFDISPASRALFARLIHMAR